jgi:hypothetical protein
MRTLAKVPRIITSWLPRRAAVAVEVGLADAVSAGTARREVRLEGAGRRDVVGRDRIAEARSSARAPMMLRAAAPASMTLKSSKKGGSAM